MLEAPRKKESKLQAEVVCIARANGYRIDLSHLHPDHRNPDFYAELEKIAPKGKMRKFLDFLFAKRQHLFSFCYHTHDSRYSQPGFPDLVMVNPTIPRIVFAELKRDGEYPTLEQRLWYAALKMIENAAPSLVYVRVWRPKDREQFVSDLGGIDPYNQ